MNEIILEPIESDVTGYGPEYYRRNRQPTEPYYVENLNFDDAVRKEHPNRDVEVEQYLLNQAYKRGQDPQRPFKKTLQVPDWGRGEDKVRTEYWDPDSIARDVGEAGHFAREGISPIQGHSYYTEEPTIRMFKDPPPYIHEAAHSLQNERSDPRRNIKIPAKHQIRKHDSMGAWNARPEEIQAEASSVKRDYVHRAQLPKTLSKQQEEKLRDRLKREPEYKEDGSVNPYHGYTVEDFKRSTFLPSDIQVLDKNHPAVRQNKPIPEEHIDNMFQYWMHSDPQGWGDFYRDNPEEFPVELFKEALRLGKKDQRPTGLFTGRGPQNA